MFLERASETRGGELPARGKSRKEPAEEKANVSIRDSVCAQQRAPRGCGDSARWPRALFALAASNFQRALSFVGSTLREREREREREQRKRGAFLFEAFSNRVEGRFVSRFREEHIHRRSFFSRESREAALSLSLSLFIGMPIEAALVLESRSPTSGSRASSRCNGIARASGGGESSLCF